MAGSGSGTSGAGSIGTSAAQLVAARQARESVLVKNTHGSQVLYLGGSSSMTTSDGFPLEAGESVRLETKQAVFAIASGAATTARYFEEF